MLQARECMRSRPKKLGTPLSFLRMYSYALRQRTLHADAERITESTCIVPAKFSKHR